MTELTYHIYSPLKLVAQRLRIYMELIKVRLSLLVAFSSGIGYLLASNGLSSAFWWFVFGGLLISGASITINQIMERDIDALMTRTRMRPLPTNRISVTEAWVFAAFLMATGSVILWYAANALTLLLSLLSFVLYSFVYTPLKRVGPVAVFVGAIPGALPPLIGWVAATGVLSYEAYLIFGIQFIWQFPHFWAIAWVADEDYKKAGIKLLPGGGKKDLNTAVNIMVYTLFLLPLGLLPARFGLTGLNSAIVATVCGVLFLAQTFLLMKRCDKASALKLMYGSFIYLPVVQIAFVLDKM